MIQTEKTSAGRWRCPPAAACVLAALIALSGCVSSPSKVPQIEAGRGQYGIPFRGEVLAIDLLSALPVSETRYGPTLGELAVRLLNRNRADGASVWSDLARLGGTALAADLEQYMASLNCVYTLRTADLEVADSISSRTLQSGFGMDTFVDSEADTFIYNDNRSPAYLRGPLSRRDGGDFLGRAGGPGERGERDTSVRQERKRNDEMALEAEARARERRENKPTKPAKGRFISVMHNCVARIGVGDSVGIVHLGERMALFPTVTDKGIASLGTDVLAVPKKPAAVPGGSSEEPPLQIPDKSKPGKSNRTKKK